jgi:hypothetical protein
MVLMRYFYYDVAVTSSSPGVTSYFSFILHFQEITTEKFFKEFSVNDK